jgi:ATP-grasp domain
MTISSRVTESVNDGVLPRDVKTTRILLTATNRWPSSSRLMIEFSRVGHVVSILCPVYHPSEKLRIVHRTFPYKVLAPLDSLAAAIEAAKPDVIIPCDDLAVRHLHHLHSSRRARYASQVDIPALIARSLGPPESYATVDSRYLLLEAARQEGILTPETGVIKNLDDLEEWGSVRSFPWVLKADGTTGGAGVRIAHTPQEARTHASELRQPMGLLRAIKRLTVNRDLILERQGWRRLRRVRPSVVAQSFIRGRDTNCAVACWKGEVLAGLCCEALSTETSVGPATVVRLIDNAEMMLAARRIARRLSWSGFFGLDFVVEEGTGAAYLIEMNPRCTPPSHLRLGMGRDMIGALSAQLSGEPASEPVSITQSDLIAYFPQALLRNSKFLPSSYHDVPECEPEFVEGLCRPSKRQSFWANGPKRSSFFDRVAVL